MKHLLRVTALGTVICGLVACGGEGDPAEPDAGPADQQPADQPGDGATSEPQSAVDTDPAVDQQTGGSDGADPAFAGGSLQLFVDSMAAGDFMTVAEIIDPASPVREQLVQLAEAMRSLEDGGSSEQRLGLLFARRLFTEPYARAESAITSQDEDTATATLTFRDGDGDVFEVVEDVRITRFDDVWLVMATTDLLVADPDVQQQARERADRERDTNQQQDDGDADQPQDDGGGQTGA